MVVLAYDERKQKFVSDKQKCEKCGKKYSPFLEAMGSKHICRHKPKHKKILNTVETGIV